MTKNKSKSKRLALVFCVCVRKDTTSFSITTQNDVAFGKQCCASHKRCGLTPNDVALRASGFETPPLLCYNILKAVMI